jgi:hypothetical protein
MAVGAFGDLHLAIVIAREAVILQWCLALATRRVDAHAAFFTFVSRHILNSPYFDVRISVCSLPTKM